MVIWFLEPNELWIRSDFKYTHCVCRIQFEYCTQTKRTNSPSDYIHFEWEWILYACVYLCLWVSCSFENWWLKTCLMLTFSAYFDIPQTNNILQSVRLAASQNVCKVLCPYWPLCACLQRLRECVCVCIFGQSAPNHHTQISYTLTKSKW